MYPAFAVQCNSGLISVGAPTYQNETTLQMKGSHSLPVFSFEEKNSKMQYRGNCI